MWTCAFYTQMQQENDERREQLTKQAEEAEKFRRENEGLAAQVQDLQEIISKAQEHPAREEAAHGKSSRDELLEHILESSQVVQEAEDEISAARAVGDPAGPGG